MQYFRLFLFVIVVSFGIFSVRAIEMEVGQKKTLSFDGPAYLKGCQWTISRPNDVRFTYSPGLHDTKVEIQAINSFPASSPCVVQCRYYYLELDPITGRYTYQRSGYKSWNIFVSDGGNDNPNYPSDKIIELNTHEIIVSEGESAQIKVRMSEGGKFITWRIDNSDIARITPNSDGWTLTVEGLKAGSAYVKAHNEGGGVGSCKITVTARAFENEEYFSYSTDEFSLGFKVLDKYKKICEFNYVRSVNTEVLHIPCEVYGLRVINIGSGEIRGEDRDKIKEVIIPNSSVSISSYAFAGWDGLKRVIIPNSITEIGEEAFSACQNLEYVFIPESINVIKARTFSGCKNLEQIVFSEGVVRIEENAFCDCGNLKEIILPNELNYIGERAFYGCKNLSSIIVGNSLKYIGEFAFRLCDNLNKVYIDNLKNWCEIRINNTYSSPLSYADSLFIKGKYVMDLIVPEDVRYIGECAFQGYEGLRSVQIPNSVISIEDYAFDGCINLRSISLGSGLKEIGSYAFDSCEELSTVISLNSIPPRISNDTFDKNTYKNAILYVPALSKDSYMKAEIWKKYRNIDILGVENKTYYLVGDMSAWDASNHDFPLVLLDCADGKERYSGVYEFCPGHHEFKFVSDQGWNETYGPEYDMELFPEMFGDNNIEEYHLVLGGGNIVLNDNFSGGKIEILLEFDNKNNSISGIFKIDGDSRIDNILNDYNLDAIYYNLQGARVNKPSNGVFIRVSGMKTEKVVF